MCYECNKAGGRLGSKGLDCLSIGWCGGLEKVPQASSYRKCVFVFFCCCNELPQTLQLKTAHTYYLTVSVGQKPWVALAGSFGLGLTGLKSRYRQTWTLKCGLWRRICFPAHSGLWQSWFPVVVRLKSSFPCWLSAGVLSPPKGCLHSCHSTLSPSHALNFSDNLLLQFFCL